MRFANVNDRFCVLAADGRAIDLARASGGRIPAEPLAAYQQWDDVRDVAGTVLFRADMSMTFGESDLRNPAPGARQVFAVGLNYRDHSEEVGLPVPTELSVFTKFPTCFTDPYADVALPAGHVDWEVELVIVIGRRAHRIGTERAWDHVAGLTVGQDISERIIQMTGAPPQFSLGKSYPGFGPMGPVLVTPDEFADPGDLEIGCAVNGETAQCSRTSQLVFPVPEIIARLSAVTPLLPGDVIFTGTPPGTGIGQTPPRYLAPGDTLTSYITGIGEIRQKFYAAE
ncbi:fumarylacetoacetate hydrolase family protein [Nocardia arthritidis]|nr:fumarylacetoacetate hydrolase family protein [Nocardia arthritidis]